MWDLSNQFVAEALTGGLATFICFVALIVICFKKLGQARKTVDGDRNQEWFLWFLGAAMFSHIMAFFGISYFDHTQISWFALLAMISAATASLIPQTVKEPEPAFVNSRVPARPAPVVGQFKQEKHAMPGQGQLKKVIR